jgi:hypothetical protein
VLEVASALVLLTGAGLMIETMAKLRAIDLGFRPDHLLTLRTPQGSLYDDSVKALEFQQRVLDQVRALPGVEAAAYASTLPFQSSGNTHGYRMEDVPKDLNFSPDALYRAGSPNYLQMLRVKLREGRFFNGSETSTSQPVIIINETFARHYWPNQPAVGHRISNRRREGEMADDHRRGRGCAGARLRSVDEAGVLHSDDAGSVPPVGFGLSGRADQGRSDGACGGDPSDRGVDRS